MRDIVLHLFFFLALLFCAPVRAKYRNVTVDNTDPSIYYVGNWSQCTASKASSYGGTRNCTAQDGANATFTFSGVAIYYIAPLFSGVQLTTALALDSESRVLVNLTMAEGLTPEWAVRWGKSGLNNGQHTLVDYGPSSDTTNPSGTWGEVDAFIYTVVEQDHNIAAIVGGTVAGVVALLLAGVCYLFGQHLADRLRDFAFGVFGWLLFKGRRFAFISDLPSETKITLFLTLTPGLTGSQAGSRGDGKKMGLCWKVLNIGGGKRQEVVHLPSSGRSADPDFVFCTLNEEDTGFKVNLKSDMAAPNFNFIQAENAYEWARSNRTGISVNNQAPHDELFALATLSDGDANPFWTFTVQSGGVQEFAADVYVHAFRTNVAVMPGFKHDISDPEFLANRITEEDGLRVSQLGPTTYWYVYQSDDRLEVEIGTTLKNIKRYRHGLKVGA